MKFLQRSSEIIVASLLLYSGLMHASNPYLFANVIAAYNLLPMALLSLIPFVLPHVMIVFGVCLIWQQFETMARFASAVLFIVFAAAQIWAWTSGGNIGCGCFGYSNEPISPKSIAVPAICAAVCVGLLLSQFSISESRQGVSQNVS
ncbi:MAG: MauE/DoxX family redox-associated membrane protein [Planctomycetota bacterium]